jgi:hypothetical protein
VPVLIMKSNDLGYTFAFDPEKRAVFSLTPYDGGKHEQIAHGVQTPEQAKFAADMWCRGYRSRAREILKKPGIKHYQILAEPGIIGVERPKPVENYEGLKSVAI